MADDVPVSRAGLDAAGGMLGAGIILPLGANTCPMGEVARIVRYLAKESSGQCGPCKLGLPGLARSMSALADGSGGIDTLDAARRAASVVRGRGACSHPDGVSRFVLSALDVFSDDLTTHLFRGSCGRPVPRPAAARAGRRVPGTAQGGLGALLRARAVRPDRAGDGSAGQPGLPDVPGYAGAVLAGEGSVAGGRDVPGAGPVAGHWRVAEQRDTPAQDGHRRPAADQPAHVQRPRGHETAPRSRPLAAGPPRT